LSLKALLCSERKRGPPRENPARRKWGLIPNTNERLSFTRKGRRASEGEEELSQKGRGGGFFPQGRRWELDMMQSSDEGTRRGRGNDFPYRGEGYE